MEGKIEKLKEKENNGRKTKKKEETIPIQF